MAIAKRRSPADYFADRYGHDWDRVTRVPIVAALCNPAFAAYVPADMDNLSRLIAAMDSRDWMRTLTINERIFLYVVSLVQDRADVTRFLTESQHEQLKRHLYTATVTDKLDSMDSEVFLCTRQALLWDLAAFARKHPTRGSLRLAPTLATSGVRVAKRKLKRPL